jgi:hypothetical protein
MGLPFDPVPHELSNCSPTYPKRLQNFCSPVNQLFSLFLGCPRLLV